MSRRRFMAASLVGAPAAFAALARAQQFPPREDAEHGRMRPRPQPAPPTPNGPAQSEWQTLGAQLARFRDLRRHFIFEYYPWYQAGPWRHWDAGGRTPPIDIAAFAVPALGPYDSRDAKAIEQHARWIADAGVGAINISWWGQGSPEDRAVPLIMDVMRAHDVHVTFHIEPYSDSRSARFADDVVYLIREYGERRRWDAFLLLEDVDGTARPLIKPYATILPRTSTNCHGVVSPVVDFTDNETWHRQLDTLRNTLGRDLSPVLLADTIDAARTGASSFDGMAIYDVYYRPPDWPATAQMFSDAGLLFSFNVNAGFDHYPDRPPFGDCYAPFPFEPPVDVSGWGHDAREQAYEASRDRVLESLRTTLKLQLDLHLLNAKRGFLAVYINSFNEWHEGTAFEPAFDFADLSSAQRAIGYHNPEHGSWRLQLLQDVLTEIEAAASAATTGTT
jgi:glycosyl hydrolase family 99